MFENAERLVSPRKTDNMCSLATRLRAHYSQEITLRTISPSNSTGGRFFDF
jgi:hypothetical protein